MTKARLRPMTICTIGVVLGLVTAGSWINWDVQGHGSKLCGGALGGLCISLLVLTKASSSLTKFQKGRFGGFLGSLIGAIPGVFFGVGEYWALETIFFALLFGLCGSWWARNIYFPGLEK